MAAPYNGRLGIVSTSRSGSTYFRRYLCNHFGLLDSKSWLKHNSYKDIDNEKFAQKPHLLKILPHYVLDETVYKDMPCIWLHRKDSITQFMSHVTRLRTKVNHITDIKDRPNIPDNSLIATREEYERFKNKLEQFWDIYYTHNGGILIAFEDFLKSPTNITDRIVSWSWCYPTSWWNIYQKEKSPLTLTVPLCIIYSEKFKNYTEIKGWFNE